MIQPKIVDFSEEVLRRFSSFLAHGRLGHAYLFVGPPQVGKSETALGVAKLINCQDRRGRVFCDACPSCLKIEKGNHPDVHLISEPEGESIKIEQIRRLNCEIQLKPFEAPKKIFIIKEIDALTLEAANAFLKTLEEPTKNSLILLTTTVLEKNLDTIQSRCQIIHFYPSGNDALERKLVENFSFDAPTAHFLAYFSEGCLGKVQKMDRRKALRSKNEIVDNFVFQGRNESYLKKILSDKQKVKESLQVLLTWFRDLMLVKLTIEDAKLIHLDRIEDLKKIEPEFSFDQIRQVIAELVDAMKLLEENLNIKLPVTLIKERIFRG